jgi:hypothetical protein
MAESKNYMKLFNSWRRYDSLATIFSILSLILAVINYELDIYNNQVIGIVFANASLPVEDIYSANPMETARYKSYYTQPFRWAILILSVLAVFCLILRNHQKIKWQKNYFNRGK